MKMKNLLITMGLAAAIGVGVGAASLAKSATQVNAKDGDIVSVTLKGSFDGWGDGVSFTPQPNGDYTLSRALTSGTAFKILITGSNVDDKWVGFNWGTSVGYDSEFVGQSGSSENYEALTSYTLDFRVKSTFYTNFGSDVSIVLGETRTVQFVDEEGNVVADSENLVAESTQYSGLITTTKANEKFRIKDTIGATENFHGTLEDGVDAEVATVSGDFISVTTPGTYVVYYKNKNRSYKCYMMAAGASQVAYVYANYFLNNVGCDPTGVAKPSGWDDCATRYASITDDAKDYIYSFDTSGAEATDPIRKMIERYEWAVNHNPNALSQFIVNSSGDKRAIAASRVTSSMQKTETNALAITIVSISVVSFAALSGFFFFRSKRKSDN